MINIFIVSFPSSAVKHELCSNYLSSKALAVVKDTNDLVISSNILGKKVLKVTEHVKEVKSGLAIDEKCRGAKWLGHCVYLLFVYHQSVLPALKLLCFAYFP